VSDILNLENLFVGDLFTIRAKPISSKSILVWDDSLNRFDAFLHSIPGDGKANLELIEIIC